MKGENMKKIIRTIQNVKTWWISKKRLQKIKEDNRRWLDEALIQYAK